MTLPPQLVIFQGRSDVIQGGAHRWPSGCIVTKHATHDSLLWCKSDKTNKLPSHSKKKSPKRQKIYFLVAEKKSFKQQKMESF